MDGYRLYAAIGVRISHAAICQPPIVKPKQMIYECKRQINPRKNNFIFTFWLKNRLSSCPLV